TEHALDRREQRLRNAILGDAAHELRPNRITDGEQKHEKDCRLQRLRDGDPNLSDQNTGEQGGGDRAQADTLERETSKVVSEAKGQENCNLRVLPKGREKPLDHV